MRPLADDRYAAWGIVNLEKQREIWLVKCGGAADGHGAGGVAVVGLGEADEFVFFAVPEVCTNIGRRVWRRFRWRLRRSRNRKLF